MQVSTIADQLFFVTGFLSGSNSSTSWSGTGFVYTVPTDKGEVHLLVSNKHVLTDADTLTIRFVRGDPTKPEAPTLGEATETTITDSKTLVVGHPDPAVDVAVMPLGPVIAAMAAAGAPPFFRALSPDLLLTDARAAELDSIEQVSFVGYPNAVFDTMHFTPVARRGTTATPIMLDYRGEPAFLVDATVFPGSSGSPVFLSNTGTFQLRDGSTVVGSRFLLLGVLAAVHMTQVDGKVTTLPATKTVRVRTPIGLGIVYRAQTIQTCVDLMLDEWGLTPSPGAPDVGVVS
ncbi:MAG TPA: trypsin-like peptidase domain-containing protein [Solirubrobacteraceae bacterium]